MHASSRQTRYFLNKNARMGMRGVERDTACHVLVPLDAHPGFSSPHRTAEISRISEGLARSDRLGTSCARVPYTMKTHLDRDSRAAGTQATSPSGIWDQKEETTMAGRLSSVRGRKHRVIAVALFSILSAATSASAQTNTFPATGNVGVGTTTPARRLDVIGNLAVTPTTGQTFALDADSAGPYMGTLTNTPFSLMSNSARRLLIDTNGNVGIGTNNPTSMLHVVGDARVDGNIAAKYQDVAEWVPTTTRISPGTVVVIDALNGNRVLPATEPYDTRVAGVVSAKPGILLGEPGDDKVSVAHSGRVKVKADAQYGAIAVGDVLVSSATLGFARRSTPIEVNGISMHRPGTILGKALEPLKEGTGEILVLLTLQ